jgi:hypothetical protein
MNFLNLHPAFDPLDLEIIDLVYEAVCVHLASNYPDHGATPDEQWQPILRKRLFAIAEPGPVGFDALWERTVGNMTEYLVARPTSDEEA